MPSTIDSTFTVEYKSDLLIAKQDMGGVLAPLCRPGTIDGKTARWNTFGTFVATTKARNAYLTPQDPDHDEVLAHISDRYVASVIDDLDLLKTNVDERAAHAGGHMYAIRRAQDDMITDTLWNSGAVDLGPGDGVSLSVDHMLALLQDMDEDEVPNDGQRFVCVSSPVFNQMIRFPEFSEAEYIGTDGIFGKQAVTAKQWMGATWLTYHGTPRSADGATRLARPLKKQPSYAADKAAWKSAKIHHCFAWHRNDLGWAEQAAPSTSVALENLMAGHSIVTKAAGGSAVLDLDGVRAFTVDLNGAAAN